MPMPTGLPNSDFAVIEEYKIRRYLLASGINDTPFVRLGRTLPSPDGRDPRVRGVWFLVDGETGPRLVTAYAASGADP
jgi:hypothetical protein